MTITEAAIGTVWLNFDVLIAAHGHCCWFLWLKYIRVLALSVPSITCPIPCRILLAQKLVLKNGPFAPFYVIPLKIDPSSIQCLDLNSQPRKYDIPPMTTRPELFAMHKCLLVLVPSRENFLFFPNRGGKSGRPNSRFLVKNIGSDKTRVVGANFCQTSK